MTYEETLDVESITIESEPKNVAVLESKDSFYTYPNPNHEQIFE